MSWWPQFLAQLAESPDVRLACTAAGVHWNTAYLHRAKFPDFAERWLQALAQGNEALKGAAFLRAVEGTDKPVYQQGVLVGTVREYSDSLLMFLMKAHMPGIYGDKSKIEHSGALALTDQQVAERGAAAEESLLATMAASVKDQTERKNSNG